MNSKFFGNCFGYIEMSFYFGNHRTGRVDWTGGLYKNSLVVLHSLNDYITQH